MKKKQVQRALRGIAERLYMGERPCPAWGHVGLCYLALRWYDGGTFEEVFRAIYPHTGKKGGYLCTPGTRWEQRAMFALILAESLED